jgi:hypothetical protein
MLWTQMPQAGVKQQLVGMLAQAPHSNKQQLVMQQSLCRKASQMQPLELHKQQQVRRAHLRVHKRQLQQVLAGGAGEGVAETVVTAAAAVRKALITRWRASWSTQCVASRARGRTR